MSEPITADMTITLGRGWWMSDPGYVHFREGSWGRLRVQVKGVSNQDPANGWVPEPLERFYHAVADALDVFMAEVDAHQPEAEASRIP